MTAFQGAGVGMYRCKVGRGHAVTRRGWGRVLHSVWHVNILQWLPQGGEGQPLPLTPCSPGRIPPDPTPAEKTAQARPLREAGKGAAHILGHSPSPAPSSCTVQLGREACSGVSRPGHLSQ